jgi:hypothetical protein
MLKMGTVWDRTAEFLTDNLATLLPIGLFAFFVPFSIRGNFAYAAESAGFEFQLVLQLVSLGFAILAVWGSLAITAMVLDSGAGASAGTTGTKRLLPALAVAVTMLAALLLAWAPAAIVIGIYGYDFEAAFTSPFGWPLALYCVVAVAFALWFSARMMLVNPVIVAEKSIFGAIPRSFRLTRGVTLPIVGVLLLYILVSLVAVLATQIVFGSIFALLAGAPDSPVSLSRVLTSVMVAAVQTGFTMIVPVFTANLYLALTQREATGQA